MKKPIIKILSGPTPNQVAAGEISTGGTASLLSAISKAADLAPMDVKQLYGFLHFRLHSAKQAQARSGWFGGRLFNKFSGESSDYVPLSGTQMTQAFLAAGIEPPEFIVASGNYELRLDYAQKAYDALKEMAETDNAQ
ncbi:hypothetical protein [Leisingera sp. MMG026]|uniref:hypothetical protein n=1 Tax=Leisingera sp. MMG026 TaxID=2909982 RepID=UPI001F24F3F3|nr:hypothetical protein [Leisingera sp. MMG026]MCF6433189.1 hypothetical protein [Leisingera sp. MMG026]